MLLPIVNEQDKIIGYKERNEIKQKDIYRVSALWIENSKGEVLLAKRAKTKSHDPLKWGPAVAGTVEKNETYKSNIIKEAEEELGLKNFEFKDWGKYRRTGKHNFWAQKYLSIIDKDISEFNISKEEVEEIKWFNKDKLKKEIKKNPDKFLQAVKQIYKERKNIKIFRYITRTILIIISSFWFIFALLSGAEYYGGGLKGILMNSPNAIPWLILLIFVFLTFKYELIGGIIISIIGITTIFMFKTFEDLIVFLIVSFPFIILGSLLITIHYLDRKYELRTNTP